MSFAIYPLHPESGVFILKLFFTKNSPTDKYSASHRFLGTEKVLCSLESVV
jgi:hypothetical protein